MSNARNLSWLPYQIYVDPATGRVGIGTTSPTSRIEAAGAIKSTSTGPAFILNNTSVGSYKSALTFQNNGTSKWEFGVDQGAVGNNNLYFWDNVAAAERGRFDASGNLIIGGVSADPIGARVNQAFLGANGGIKSRAPAGQCQFGINSTSGVNAYFYTDSGTAFVTAGNISSNSATTAYNTTSDYRLKTNIKPLANGLDTVAKLKPVTFTWKLDGRSEDGFIAHELQEVCPQAVTGDKDAVDAEGNPVYQSVDTSFLIATLTLAIQELKQEVDSLKAQLAS